MENATLVQGKTRFGQNMAGVQRLLWMPSLVYICLLQFLLH